MTWITPKYSKLEINQAGKILTNDRSPEEKKDEATEILDNWRASHSYPMHVFKIRLKNKAVLVDPKSITVQRLKRVPAIVKKLKRSYGGDGPAMQVFTMQDIGGCRAVLSNVKLARELCDKYYLKSDLKHKRVGQKDYITNPKKDGYRSIHLIYQYVSDKRKKEFNGLLVEIQIRSKLQHLWATAVETVDFFTRQAIKSNEGQEEWMEFFKLVSSAFAKIEGCPTVPNTPDDEKTLYFQIRKKEEELNVIKKMEGWMTAVRVFEHEQKRKRTTKAQYFLLELDIRGGKLSVTSYNKNEEMKAIKDYAESEKKNKDMKEYDVVLVGADKSTDLKKAYPNYFVDSGEFLATFKGFINKYQSA